MFISISSRFSVNNHVEYNKTSRIKFTACIKRRQTNDINIQRYQYRQEIVSKDFWRLFLLK